MLHRKRSCQLDPCGQVAGLKSSRYTLASIKLIVDVYLCSPEVIKDLNPGLLNLESIVITTYPSKQLGRMQLETIKFLGSFSLKVFENNISFLAY